MRIDEVLVYEERLNAKPIISAAIIKLDKVFKDNNHEMRIVGGAVRDIALGKSPKDIDFATDATPDEMMAILDKAGIRHKPTGLEHGTITAILDNEPFEITTLRADTETDGRHAKVEFVKSWEEDAKRRDLTYNAMSMDIEGNVYDYFGGMDDLQDKVSKFVGDAEERITEDYLRILRYFRFQGRLSKPTWDGDTLEAITKHAKGLSGISAERIWAEMGKVLSGQNVASVVSMIEKTGVSKVIGLSTNNINTLKDKSNPVLALAQLDNSVDLAKRWKFSNSETQLLDFLVKNKNNPLDQKKVEDMIADGVNKDLISALATMQGKKVNTDAEVPNFPLTGADLIAKGMKPGPEMGAKLGQLKQKWKASNFTATKDDLLKENIKSLFEDLDPKSELYVDMDGVLADFFGVWNKMMGVKHWKDIPDIDKALQKIKDTDDFWINLPMTPNGKSLLNAIKKFKGKYNILSAPLPGDPNSEPQKRAWIRKHLSMFPPAKIIIDHNKAAYAKQADGTPNALIDDFGENISKWRSAGGVGIQHKDIEVGDTISKLAQELEDEQEPVNEAKDGLPVKTLKGLYHVGTLDASKKRDGFEGAGLSVSTHPDAWKQIARGHVTGDTHSATKEGNKFLDVHSLSATHNEQIKQWALENDYLAQQETVTVCYYDDEMEDDLCSTFNSMADAEAEYDEELEHMDVSVDKGGIVPTDKLKKETRQNRIESTGVLEFVLPIFAEQQGLDGVWWQDKLDVNRYSAPRGVIVPSKIKSWKFAVNETKAFNEATEMKISDLTISDAGMAIAQSVGGGSRTDAPLAVTKLPSGHVYLVNGYHRLVDAMQAGKDTVSVEYVPYEKVEILWKQEREQDIKYGKQFNENFADGKVKGKSRPGRVKKSGASCNGSVTELRAKAKKASGEKAKMYHWCANMKGGKKK